MDAKQILKSDLLDIIFDGRNKEYGAYDLRRTYSSRMIKGLIGTGVIIALVLGGRAIASKFQKDDEVEQVMVVNETTLKELDQPKDEPPPPPPPPPPNLPPPPPVATVQFTPPKVVKDVEVVDPPPDVSKLEEAKIDIKTQEGVKDVGIVAPPSEEVGTGVIAPPPPPKKKEEDKIFTKVEKEAEFPGGAKAWAKYVSEAIQRQLSEFTESDYGTCVVKFVVDKTGKVSDVTATTMQGTKLAEIAVNAIRKGPRWVPAQQNGRYVNAYRLQPVTLKNPNF